MLWLRLRSGEVTRCIGGHSLSGTTLHGQAALAVVALLRSLPRLTALSLRRTDLGADGLEALAADWDAAAAAVRAPCRAGRGAGS